MVLTIEPLRVHAIDMPHQAGEIAGRGAKKDMVVVGHQTISIHDPIEQADPFFKSGQKSFIVFLILENLSLARPTVHHVVTGAWKFYAQRPAHENTLTPQPVIVK